MTVIGENIAALRRKAGLTQEELSEKMCVTAQAVSKWENDLSCPDIETIRRHCKEKTAMLWSEVVRFENPHPYYVDLSQKLWDIKRELLEKY